MGGKQTTIADNGACASNKRYTTIRTMFILTVKAREETRIIVSVVCI